MICNYFSPYMTGIILQHYQERIGEAKSLKELEVIQDQIEYHFSRLSTALKQITFVNQHRASHERRIIHYP